MRLDVSAVQHDMKREETVEEVEKNTEWQRRTPKRKVGDSSSFWRAMRDPAASLNTRLAVGSFFAYLIVAPQSSSTSVVRNGTNPSSTGDTADADQRDLTTVPGEQRDEAMQKGSRTRCAAPERLGSPVISISLDNRPHKCYYSPCKYYLEEPYAA